MHRAAAINFSFAFRTKKDCAMRVKEGGLQAHPNPVLRHLTIRQDRHVAKSGRWNPLAWSALRYAHRRRKKAFESP
jgi:hypothetical protein